MKIKINSLMEWGKVSGMKMVAIMLLFLIVFVGCSSSKPGPGGANVPVNVAAAPVAENAGVNAGTTADEIEAIARRVFSEEKAKEKANLAKGPAKVDTLVMKCAGPGSSEDNEITSAFILPNGMGTYPCEGVKLSDGRRQFKFTNGDTQIGEIVDGEKEGLWLLTFSENRGTCSVVFGRDNPVSGTCTRPNGASVSGFWRNTWEKGLVFVETGKVEQRLQTTEYPLM